MFETNLDVRLVNIKNGKSWKLLADLVYNDKVHGLIGIPEGFETDFASVPRIPVVFELVGGYGHAAACVHDYLYHHGDLSRKEVDAILFRALRDTNNGKIRSVLMYAGVRAFGWMFYKKN